MTVAPLAFDTEPARACIHCGMCLEACPTYLVTRLETESPRGRIHLMQHLADGGSPTAALRGHLDRCLACRACEVACPSGVGYGALIENARAALDGASEASRSPVASLARRLAFGLFAHPGRLELVAGVLALYERTGLRSLVHRTGLRAVLPRGLRRLEAMYPPLTRPRYRPPASAPASPSARVALLLGCVMRVAYGDVHTAAARVLQRLGVEVIDAPSQVCCGALHAHTGARAEAIALAKTNIAAFESAGVDAVVVDAAGCGSHLKGYAHLLAGDPVWGARAEAFSAKVRDVTEYLSSLGGGSLGTLDLRVTYQEPCHLAHAQRIRAEPRALLSRVRGLELVEMAESDVCCGSAGSYNITQPALADALLERKLAAIEATHADAVVSANPGCMLQVQSGLQARGSRLPVLHVVEVLDRALARP
ncbi:MAG TPA: heterodisulfide reductase-related iron-sulfur binding cluster [Candidatus Limnocylindria bacterium]|nr:heterodisulfide reductase-related iron-sulfur binding cluster [Candidatus Limnocylindria bacterium]